MKHVHTCQHAWESNVVEIGTFTEEIYIYHCHCVNIHILASIVHISSAARKHAFLNPYEHKSLSLVLVNLRVVRFTPRLAKSIRRTVKWKWLLLQPVT